METVYQVFEIAATAIEMFIALDFMTKFLGSRFEKTRQVLTFGIAFAVNVAYMLTANALLPQYVSIQDMIVIILWMSYTVFCTKDSLPLKIITPAITMTAIVIINLTLLFLFSFIRGIPMNTMLSERNGFRILLLFLTKYLFFILTQLALQKLKHKDIVILKSEFCAASLSFLCSAIIILYFLEIQFHAQQNSIDTISIVAFCSILVLNVASTSLFIALVRKNQEQTRNLMIQMQYQEQVKMFQAICSAYKNLEILQHDMKNDLLSLQTLVHQNKIQEAEQFIEQYTGTKLEQFRIFVRTGYEMLDAVINIKLNYARECGIDISCQITADFSPYAVEDIVSLFSNAIDNAIEASAKLSNRHIAIVICNKRNYLCMTVSNTIEKSVLADNASLDTTKSEKKLHGFGRQSMQQIIKKYDGMMESYEKNGMFITQMMLRNTKQEEKTTKQENAIDL